MSINPRAGTLPDQSMLVDVPLLVPSTVAGCPTPMADAKLSTGHPLVYFSVNGRLDAVIEAVRQPGGGVLADRQLVRPCGVQAIVKDSEGNRSDRAAVRE